MLDKIFHFIYNKNEPEIEKRLFCIAVFVAIVASVLSLIINMQLGLHWILHFIIGFGGVMLLWIYIMARYYGYFLKRSFIGTALIIISGSWLYNDGPNGSINYVYILSLVVFLSIIKRKYHLYVSVLVAINLLLLYGIYFLYPDLIHPYQNESVRQSDMLLTFVYVVFFAALIYSALRMSYESEKIKVDNQKAQIENAHKNITDSIIYAENIQNALLQNEVDFVCFFKHHFVFWKPKDIISGDFYLVIQHPFNENVFFAVVADCTGHGVPGALLSILGMSFIKEIVLQNPDIKSSVILDKLRDKMIDALSQGTASELNPDGMDIGICKIDKKLRKMDYAGSNLSLYIIRDKKLLVYKPDKMPISFYLKDSGVFKNIEIDLFENDNVVLATDGFADQFGGITKSKFQLAKLKSLLVDISSESANNQKNILVNEFNAWRLNEEQTDDILIFSFVAF